MYQQNRTRSSKASSCYFELGVQIMRLSQKNRVRVLALRMNELQTLLMFLVQAELIGRRKSVDSLQIGGPQPCLATSITRFGRAISQLCKAASEELTNYKRRSLERKLCAPSRESI